MGTDSPFAVPSHVIEDIIDTKTDIREGIVPVLMAAGCQSTASEGVYPHNSTRFNALSQAYSRSSLEIQSKQTTEEEYDSLASLRRFEFNFIASGDHAEITKGLHKELLNRNLMTADEIANINQLTALGYLPDYTPDQVIRTIHCLLLKVFLGSTSGANSSKLSDAIHKDLGIKVEPLKNTEPEKLFSIALGIVDDLKEDSVISNLSTNKDPIKLSIYGAGHDFENNIEKWNREHPEEAIAHIRIIPNTIERFSWTPSSKPQHWAQDTYQKVTQAALTKIGQK